MTIRNLKKLKKDGENFEMSFYEIQFMMGEMRAGLLAQAREQAAQEAANNTRRLTQEINDLKGHLRVVKH